DPRFCDRCHRNDQEDGLCIIGADRRRVPMIVNSTRILAVGLTAIVLGAGAFALLPGSAHNSGATAAVRQPTNAARSEPRVETVQWKIVPADPLKSEIV